MILGIFGYGKMGKSIESVSADFKDVTEIIICDKGNSITDFIEKSDFIIDFAIPEATNLLVKELIKNPKPALIGTTDLSEETLEYIKEISKNTSIMQVSNVSIGANLLAKTGARISHILGDEYDIDITDIHHREKIDAPSGTALMIANEINKSHNNEFEIITSRANNPIRGKKEIAINTTRAGRVAGEHTVTFTGELDSFSITQTIFKRELLSKGALKAAIWTKNQKNGSYVISDMIDL